MIHAAARLHAFVNGLFRPSDESTARELYVRVADHFIRHNLDTEEGRNALAYAVAEIVIGRIEADGPAPSLDAVAAFVLAVFDYERMFALPSFDWQRRRSVSQYWELKDQLSVQLALAENLDGAKEVVAEAIGQCIAPIMAAIPEGATAETDVDGIAVPTSLLHTIGNIGTVAEAVIRGVFLEDIVEKDLFPRMRSRLDANLIVASGRNLADPQSFKRTPKLPSKSDISDPADLANTYLGGTPLRDLFSGSIDFVIPTTSRFEHHHIIAGSGHGKTQTLQYLISEDLLAVSRGERSIVVLDSQGDLINNIARLKIFAPGEPLHDRVVIIDPTDVEWPVSLNLFDVGLERLDQYSALDRERLVNSILELYDFVLGSLLAAEMTQKQSVIFRYVTRLMLHIPDATIHTLRRLMEPKSEEVFAEHIAKLHGTARHFFETEFADKEFSQTRKQVLRRLWGILENQTFERMFSHPRSKLDLYAEMNAGKVILINTAKDLLKETGTEIFGRFFIAMIAQAAQERATLPAHQRMPTIVYIDEAADYFDRNVGLILSQARKYKVGMVLAHQYLGQLEPKLQEAFSANTSIKFAGGVSARDARTLAPMLYCEPSFIEWQPKLSFAAHVRGVTKSAIPLSFPYGRLEEMEQMTASEQKALRDVMRRRYAVHYSTLTHAMKDPGGPAAGDVPPKAKPPQSSIDPDNADTRAKPEW